MSTTNSSSTSVPPGTIIASSFVPLTSQISFTNPRPTTPLPPLVQSYYNAKTNNLQVCAIVFIDSSLTISSFSVYYNPNPKNPIFNIAYDSNETTASTFNAYQINFEVSNLNPKPSSIQTVVYDIDPVNSRGTTTTVQP
ncbi:hypothetical protein [Flavobacterium sp.]|uniref:hypothetical protein n=1 Tax=Flavobacterium sp. TaxID=239 RepID=UPI003790E76D